MPIARTARPPHPPRPTRHLALLVALACLAHAEPSSASCTACAPSSTVESSRRQHDNAIWRQPDGWRNGLRDGYATLRPADTKKAGSCTISIGTGEPAPRDLAAWLRERMRAVVEEGDEITTSKAPQTARMGEFEVVMGGQSVEGDLQMHMGIVAGGTIVHVWFQGPADEQGQATLTDVFLPLVQQMQWVSVGAKPLLGKPRSGALDGLYFGSVMALGIDGFLESQSRFWVFTAEGRFFEGLPKGRSPKTLDFSTALRLEGTHCGNYSVRGATLQLRFADGHTDERSFATHEGSIAISGDKFWPQEPIRDGLRLDGCWTALNYHSFGEGTGVKGGAGSSHSLTLRADGHFESEGLGFASANFEHAGDLTGGFSSRSESGKKRGTYIFRDGVLELTDSEGGKSTVNVFFLSPRVMLLEGTAHIDGSKPDKGEVR